MWFLVHRYRLAESLNTQLDDMSRSLSGLIQDVNSLSRSNGISSSSSNNNNKEGDSKDSEGQVDPVAQIAAILNAHLHSLSWLETASENLKRNIDEMEGKVAGVSQGAWPGFKGRRGQIQGGQRGMMGGYR